MVKYVKSIKFGEDSESYIIRDEAAHEALDEILEGDKFVETEQGLENSGKVLSVNEFGKVVPETLDIPSVEGLASEEYVDNAIETVEGKIPSIEGLASESYVDTAVSAKQDTLIAGTNIVIENNVISATGESGASSFDELVGDPMDNEALASVLNSKADTTALEGLATESYVDTAVNGLASESYVDTAVSAKQDTIDSSHKLDVALVDGALTSSDLNGYATENYVDTAVNGLASESYVDTAVSAKQDTLVSGTNIKTINNQSILGEGNITIEGVTDYDNLNNRPQIAGVTLTGNKSLSDLGIAAASDLASKQDVIDASHKLNVAYVDGAATSSDLATKQDTIDSSNKLDVALVDGAATESALEELADVVETNEENYQADKDEYIVHIEHHKSTNLYDKSLMMDHKLLSFGKGTGPADDPATGFIKTLDIGIVSGLVPVEEGKTYTVVGGTTTNRAIVGCMCFAGADKKGICSCEATNPTYAYGENSGSSTFDWPRINGYATCTYDSTSRSNTFTILEGSGIRYVAFFITKAGATGNNYWGTHDDLSVVANYAVQMNEGSEVLPYEEYYEPWDEEIIRYEEYTDAQLAPIDDHLDEIDDHLDEIDDIIDDYVVESRPSNNLFDKSLIMDHKLINYGGGWGTYAESIGSGYVPVEEGKTYTVVGGKESQRCFVGAICFVDENYNRVCGGNATSPMTGSYGGGSNYWTPLSGFVEASYNSSNKSNTFTVLEGSGIRYLMFFITRIGGTSGSASNNYWGPHDDLSVIADYQVQMNEGTQVLPYEEYGITVRKAKYEIADQELQASVDTQLTDLREDVEDELDRLGFGGKVQLQINGNAWTAISDIEDNSGNIKEMKLTGEIQANRTNHLFEFGSHYLNNVAIKGDSDDITPVNGSSPGRWSGTYIGANHGQSNGYTLTFAEPHGKDNSDIGSIWSKGGTQYTIYEVPSATTVRVVNVLTTPGTGAGTMTHVSGATHTEDMVYTSAAMDQMYRSVNGQTIHLYDADWKEIPLNEAGTYKSDRFRFVQSYYILNPDKAVEHIQQMKADGQDVTRDNLHDDGIQPFLRHDLCYEINEGCAITLYQSTNFLDTFSGFHGFVQSGAMNGTPSASSPEENYIPNWNNNDPIDCVDTESSISFSRSGWVKPNEPPYRYYQFKKNDKSYGFMQGFYTKIGIGRPEIRDTMVGSSSSGSVGFFYKTGKMYPYMYSGQTFHAGDKVEGVAFYTPFTMDTVNTNCYAAVYNYVYDDIILAIDYQQADDVMFHLKSRCIGKKIEVMDKTDSVIFNREYANGDKLPITFTDKGYIVLRFYEDSNEYDDNVLVEEDLYTKIKTVNGNSLIGSGNLEIEASGVPELRADFEALNTQYQADRDDFLVNTHTTTNLFKSDYLIDSKLISYDERGGFLSTYANSIIARVPVEEGKTYTLRVNDGNGHNLHAGAVCFGVNDTNTAGVFGVNATSLTSYGSNTGSTQYDGWPIDSNIVTISYNSSQASNTFTIHEGSGIKWLYFYIRKNGESSNYYGAHSDLSVLANYQIQLNEGSTLLPYEPWYADWYSAKWEDADEELEASIPTLVDDAVDTATASINAEIDDINSNIDAYVRGWEPSTNLFNKANMLDHKLITYGPTTGDANFVTFANSIVSGWVPVEEGKTYTVIGGKLTQRTHVGAIVFVNANKAPVCGLRATTPTVAYGAGSSSPAQNWVAPAGFVTCTYNGDHSNTFTVLEGSGIRYCAFYIRKSSNTTGDNYWGEHTDLSVVADYAVQMNEGSTLLPYEDGGPVPYGLAIPKETNITVADSTASDLATLVSNFNTLLQALRDRNVIASN